MKISIIGPMASGKSTVGALLAQKLQCPFYDTDKIIENSTNLSIADIFNQAGEDYFRTLETKHLEKLLQQKVDCVIATGGGIIKHQQNRVLLKKYSRVIFLDASINTQLQHTAGDDSRPILMVANKAEKLASLRTERMPLYQAIADQIICVDGLTPTQISAMIA